MTPKEQQITIAEACGWRRGVGSNSSGWVGEGWVWGETRRWRLNLPNYLTDLNAMHDAEKVLTPETRPDYLCKLFDAATRGRAGLYTVDENYLTHHATAAQRAEAFLRAIGRWNEH